MKKVVTLLVIVLSAMFLLSVQAAASPFLVCDPQSGVAYYKITGDSFWSANIPAQADGSLRADLAGISSGTHNINIAACLNDPSFGEVCSATAPFAFTKPSAPGAPTNTRLAP